MFYAQFAELEPDVASAFIPIVRAMDRTYLEWYAKKAKDRKNG